MDPGRVVDVAAAAIQFLSFATAVATGTWRESSTTTTSTTTVGAADLTTVAVRFGEMASGLSQAITKLESASEKAQASETVLSFKETYRDCLSKAKHLHDVISEMAQRLRPEHQVQSIWQALKEELGRKEIESLVNALSSHQKSLLPMTVSCLCKCSEQNKLVIGTMQTQMARLHEALPEPNKILPESATSQDPTIASLARGNEALERVDWEGAELSNIRTEIIKGLSNEPWSLELMQTAQNETQEPMPFPNDSVQLPQAKPRRERYENIEPACPSTFKWIWGVEPPTSSAPVGTPQWSSFPAWLEGSSTKPYWVNGKPGSGKSTLMKFIHDHQKLPEHLSRWKPVLIHQVISFYAWNHGPDADKTIGGLLWSIMSQLVETDPEMLSLVLRERWSFNTPFWGSKYPSHWDNEVVLEMEMALMRFLSDYRSRKKFLILIDGLHEFETTPRKLIRTIESINKHDNVKLCASSRPWTPFMDAFSSFHRLDLHHLTPYDIETYVSHTLQVSRSRENSHAGVAYALKPILERSGGAFYCVKLAVRLILQRLMTGDDGFVDIMNQMADELSDFYTDMWNRVLPHQQKEASMIISLLHNAPGQRLHFMLLWAVVEREYANMDLVKMTAKSPQKIWNLVVKTLHSRSFGLLELDSEGFVRFLDPTVPAWLSQRGILQQRDAKPELVFLEGLCALGAHMLPDHLVFDCIFPGSQIHWREFMQKSIMYHISHIASAGTFSDQEVDAVVNWLERLEKDLGSSGRLTWTDDWTYQSSVQPTTTVEVLNWVDVMATCGFHPFVKRHIQRNKGSVSDSLLFFCIHGHAVTYGPAYSQEAQKLVSEPLLDLLRLCLQHGVTPCRLDYQGARSRTMQCALGDVVKDCRELCNTSPMNSEAHKYYNRVVEIVEDWLKDHPEKIKEEEPVGVSILGSTVDGSSAPSAISKSIFSREQASTMPSSIASRCSVDNSQIETSSLLFPMTSHEEAADEGELAIDDILSLASFDGDTASTMDSGPVTARQQQAAVNYLVQMFTQDEELSSMYELAFRKMDLERFKRNHRKLLQYFAVDLCAQEGVSPSQQQTIAFLRRWTTRTQLSAAIFSVIQPTGFSVQETVNQLVCQQQDSLFSINRFLEAKDAPEDAPVLEDAWSGQSGRAETGSGKKREAVGDDRGEPESSDKGDISKKNLEGEESGRREEANPDDREETESRGSEEIESDDDDWHSIGVPEEVEEKPENLLSKLEETREFLCAGHAFILYKANLRRFLQPEPGPVDAEAQTAGLEEGLQETTDLEVVDPKPQDTDPRETEASDPTSQDTKVQDSEPFETDPRASTRGGLDPVDPEFPTDPTSPAPEPENQRTNSEESGSEYDISFTRPLWLVIKDTLKRELEHAAGTQLSWWPLVAPEKDLKPGYTRVYSMEFANGRFYHDIPRPVADSLFPKLPEARLSAPKPFLAALGQDAVYLKDSTPVHHLRRRDDQRGTQSPFSSLDGQAADGLKEGADDQNQAPQVQGATNIDQRQKQNGNPIIFVSGDIGRKDWVALAVSLGEDDKATMRNLRAASRSLACSWGWKRATGLQFFRFRSFHYEQSHNRRRISLHNDRERYPDESHAEYKSYIYKPSPWKDGDEFPCSSEAAWFYFQHPDNCGTSKDLNESLPVRLGDAVESQITAWGVHVEQRWSFLVIVVPILLVILAVIGATIWFVFWWLEHHPSDLQGATVPIALGMTVITPFISTAVCLMLFRWST